MSKVSITRSLLDDLATSISEKSGESVPMTLTEMKDAVDSIQTGGTLQTITKSYTPTESQQTETITAGSGYDGIEEVDVTVGAISSTYVGSGITRRDSTDLTASGATVSVPSGYYASNASKAVSSGAAGTPTATKGTVSNHQVSITPSVTNTSGYISGGTINGTAVTVTASELASGNKAITQNGTDIDVVGYSTVSVDVQGGGGYTWEVLSDQNVTITADSPNPNYFYWTFTDPLSADETYRITWGTGGTQYICETIVDPIQFTYDGYYLGNAHVVDSSYEDTGEPFMLYRNSATRMIGLTNHSTGSWHIKVEKQVPTSATLIEKSITANGTYTATDDSADGYSKVTVNVSGGTSKNAQVVQSTTRTSASTLTAIGAELTVSKTGTYDIYYSCFRTNTSASYTWATRLYINGTAYGTAENTTWTNNQQNTHLSNISLTADDKLRVYGRNTRGTSYYICAPMLTIIET